MQTIIIKFSYMSDLMFFVFIEIIICFIMKPKTKT